MEPETREVLRNEITHWLRLYRNERNVQRWELDKFVSDYEAVLPETSPTKLQVAMNQAMKMTKFMPVPEEVLKALESILDHEPQRKEARDDCKVCAGTGWRIVMTKDGRKARPCDCRILARRRKAG